MDSAQDNVQTTAGTRTCLILFLSQTPRVYYECNVKTKSWFGLGRKGVQPQSFRAVGQGFVICLRQVWPLPHPQSPQGTSDVFSTWIQARKGPDLRTTWKLPPLSGSKLIVLGGSFPAGGHDNPLQYSCLESSMDRGAWQATVHGVVTNTFTFPLWRGYSWWSCLCVALLLRSHPPCSGGFLTISVHYQSRRLTHEGFLCTFRSNIPVYFNRSQHQRPTPRPDRSRGFQNESQKPSVIIQTAHRGGIARHLQTLVLIS